MPNWCEGSIRIRGKKEDIKSFLKNEIVCVYYDKEQNDHVEIKPEIEESDWHILLSMPNTYWRDFYIKNTRRNFFFTNQIEVCWPDEDEDKEIVVCIEDFNAAWSFKDDGWVEHSTKYNIDIRLIGYDQNMLFSQTKSFYRNYTKDEDVKEYKTWNDWMWECPCPHNGG